MVTLAPDAGSVPIVNGVSPNRLKVAESVANSRSGGVDLTNLTVAAHEGVGGAARAISRVRREVAAAGGRIATTRAHLRPDPGGVPGIIIGFQNAAPVEDDLENLDALYLLGLRILQLTYQKRNLLADGCGEPGDAGLSKFGRSVIARSNELGILVDLGHVGERSSMDAIETSAVPCVISHANLQWRTPHPRNKSKALASAIADSGGVFGLTAIARLLRPDGSANGADLTDLADQIEELCGLIGAQHVGIGLDIVEDLSPDEYALRQRTFFAEYPELAGTPFPLEHYYARGVTSSRDIPAIAAELVRRGFTDTDVGAVMGGNFARVLTEAWRD